MNIPLKVTTPSEREIALTRTFDAPRDMVWDAWTRPELLQRWLGVQNGWTFPVCEIDLRVGGAYRYVWRGPTGESMGMGGVFREINAPRRLVSSEKFDDPWYEGEGVGTVTFEEKDGRTTVTMLLRYESKDIRDGVLRSPMDQGVERSYQKLDALLASTARQRA
jgi:uncharacterized protein YndB with AHSA1/START domain